MEAEETKKKILFISWTSAFTAGTFLLAPVSPAFARLSPGVKQKILSVFSRSCRIPRVEFSTWRVGYSAAFPNRWPFQFRQWRRISWRLEERQRAAKEKFDDSVVGVTCATSLPGKFAQVSRYHLLTTQSTDLENYFLFVGEADCLSPTPIVCYSLNYSFSYVTWNPLNAWGSQRASGSKKYEPFFPRNRRGTTPSSLCVTRNINPTDSLYTYPNNYCN